MGTNRPVLSRLRETTIEWADLNPRHAAQELCNPPYLAHPRQKDQGVPLLFGERTPHRLGRGLCHPLFRRGIKVLDIDRKEPPLSRYHRRAAQQCRDRCRIQGG